MSHVPLLLSSNRFSVLEITEPKIDEDTQEPDTPALPPTEPRKPRRPKWEKWIKRKLVIRSLELWCRTPKHHYFCAVANLVAEIFSILVPHGPNDFQSILTA